MYILPFFLPRRCKEAKIAKMGFENLSPQTESIAKSIIDAAFAVHYNLGPGLLEKVYEKCIIEEFKQRSVFIEKQVAVPIIYKGININEDLRLDLLVEREIIVELKAVEVMHPVFEAQLLTYLKLTGKELGFLINFNVPLIKDGIRRLRKKS